MTGRGLPGMYGRLARWWPLLSPPGEYAEEAAWFLAILDGCGVDGRRPRVLELGCGGGHLASHLTAALDMTLTDLSPAMLAHSRALNPSAEHAEGDMRTLRLRRRFDAVLIHDAVCYLTRPRDVRAAIATAAAHLRPGGTLVVAPDWVAETFTPGTDCGGADAADGGGARYLAWTRDPDPADTTVETVYAVVTRDAHGAPAVELDVHMEGLFPEGSWLDWLEGAGFSAHVEDDGDGRRVFVAALRPPPDSVVSESSRGAADGVIDQPA